MSTVNMNQWNFLKKIAFVIANAMFARHKFHMISGPICSKTYPTIGCQH